LIAFIDEKHIYQNDIFYLKNIKCETIKRNCFIIFLNQKIQGGALGGGSSRKSVKIDLFFKKATKSGNAENHNHHLKNNLKIIQIRDFLIKIK
jgi:hypothetical protein